MFGLHFEAQNQCIFDPTGILNEAYGLEFGFTPMYMDSRVTRNEKVGEFIRRHEKEELMEMDYEDIGKTAEDKRNDLMEFDCKQNLEEYYISSSKYMPNRTAMNTVHVYGTGENFSVDSVTLANERLREALGQVSKGRLNVILEGR